jgi:hypothetical protein
MNNSIYMFLHYFCEMQGSDIVDLGEFVLSAELVGHDRDVRGICGLRSGDVATTSRDNTVRIWRRDSAEGVCV